MMSAHLRNEARSSGWPDHIVSNLHVRHNDGKFTVHAHPDHYQEVMDLEYGTPSRQPSAVIRKFSNDQRLSSNFLVKRMFHHLGSNA